MEELEVVETALERFEPIFFSLLAKN